ncbi:MAG: XRE family transcriptional regulator, partial [Oscillospiraceae bacterium]|nr:XRE family transcriptional regulator [Oscillospiraceae bacterium]
LEHGNHNPSIETLSRLIVPLGITLPELFNDNTEMSFLTEKERELVEIFRSLPESKAETLLLVAKTFTE